MSWQADDIDGVTTIDDRLAPGEFADVAVEEVIDDYDFRAALVARIDRRLNPVASPPRRALPMVSIGSYGR